MLLQNVNKHISKNDFRAAYMLIKKYIRRGGLFTIANLRIRDRRAAFQEEYAGYFDNPTSEQIQNMGVELQDLAEVAERDLVIKRYFNLSNLIKLGWLFIPALFGLLMKFYHEIPRFENDDRTKLLIYDFENLTSKGDYNIDDLLSSSINSPRAGIWGKYFEAKRFVCSSEDHSFLHENFLEKILLKKIQWLFSKKPPDHKIGGWLMEDEDGYTLRLETVKAGSEIPKITSIKLDHIKDILTSPCGQSFLLSLLDIENVPSKDSFLIDLNKYVADCALQSDNICSEIEQAYPEIHIDFCKKDTLVIKPVNLVNQIYEKMDSIRENAFAKLLTLRLENDTIFLSATFNKDKYKLPPMYKKVLAQLGECYQKQMDYLGEGYACDHDGPGVDNNKLSKQRIDWLLIAMGPTFESNGVGMGATERFDPDGHSGNRVATIKFFINKTEHNSGDLLSAK